ncbi:hypothetical protein PGT21_010031 [Puccinia graminis f. sp. tritici]|uniref:Uncharacterized protein n=1 Tax=Puccinia graminis f. sp. tritici TaxID=56615 RepID=A0A5B0QFK8_PUCGR|nr:hypothetical protein PGT21_010031 [Puccinia graminis f. sp. tritici]
MLPGSSHSAHPLSQTPLPNRPTLTLHTTTTQTLCSQTDLLSHSPHNHNSNIDPNTA